MQAYNKLFRQQSNSQKGSALISALFIMTLVVIAATALSLRLQLDIYRTQTAILNEKINHSSEIVLFWAIDFLIKTKKPDSFNKQMIGKLPDSFKNIYPNIKITGELYDLQAQFNINNLQDPRFYPIFTRLLNETKTETKKEIKTKDIVKAIAFWLRAYRPEYKDDIYLPIYLKTQPSYYPAYQNMQTISELNLVANINPIIYQALQPYVMVAPEKTPINIYTASPKLLKVYGNDLSEAQLKSLLKARSKKDNSNKLHHLLEKLDMPPWQVSLGSTYFVAIATISSQQFNTKIYSVLKKNIDKNGNLRISLIKQSINTL